MKTISNRLFLQMSVVILLLSIGDLQMLSGVGAVLDGGQLESFGSIAQQQGIPFQVEGERLNAVFK